MQRHTFGRQDIDHIIPRPQAGDEGRGTGATNRLVPMAEARGLRRASSVKQNRLLLTPPHDTSETGDCIA